MSTDVNGLIEAGMRRQILAYRGAIAAGMPRTGWKIGINDPAAQRRMGLSVTLVGWLDGRRVLGDGEAYRPPAGARPRIEAEVAIIVARDVPADASPAEARAAIRGVAPAIEFVDGTKPVTPIDELLAHDILHEAVMFGTETGRAKAGGLTPAGYPRVKLNGEAFREVVPGRYPEDIGEIVAHVARVLGQAGERLSAGDRIIGGSYIDPFEVVPGDRVEADFGPLGTLRFEVAAQ